MTRARLDRGGRAGTATCSASSRLGAASRCGPTRATPARSPPTSSAPASPLPPGAPGERERRGARAVRVRAPRRGRERGIFHVCFVPPDVDGTAARIAASGGRRTSRVWQHLPGRALPHLLLRGPVRQHDRALLAQPRADLCEPLTRSERLLRRALLSIPGGVNTAKRRARPRLCFRRGGRPHRGPRRPPVHRLPRRVRRDPARPLATRRVARVADAIEDTVLFGVGVTEAEVAARRADRRARPVGRADGALQQRLRGDLPRDPAGPRRDRAPDDHQVPGLLPRLPRLRAPQRPRRAGAAPRGMLEAAIDATLVCRVQRPRGVARRSSAHRETSPRSSSSRPAQRRRLLPAPGSSRACARSATATGALLIFDEVITGFRHALGGYQAIAGVTPDLTTMGKAIANGFPLAAIAGRREHMERFNDRRRRRRALRRHLQRQRRRASRRGWPRSSARGRRGPRARLRPRRADARGPAEVAARVGVPAGVGGFGSLFVLCFMDGPLETYEDVLRNDDAAVRPLPARAGRAGRVRDAREPRAQPLGRHTDGDVDRTLEAAEEALRSALRSPPA